MCQLGNPVDICHTVVWHRSHVDQYAPADQFAPSQGGGCVYTVTQYYSRL